jgi:hypothetical protein
MQENKVTLSEAWFNHYHLNIGLYLMLVYAALSGLYVCVNSHFSFYTMERKINFQQQRN